MKSLLLLFTMSIYFSLSGQEAQSEKKLSKSIIYCNHKLVYKWEGITRNNMLVYGVESSEDNAKAKISDFNSRNWNTNYRIVHHTIIKDSVRYLGKEDYFEIFKKRLPKGYYLLSFQETMATEIYMNEGLYEAIEYYRKAKKIPYPTAKNHLENIIFNLAQYRINFTYNPQGQSN